MSRPTTFLARETYRRRRLIDAMRVLPGLGVFLFLVPILGAGQGVRSTAWSGIYLFVVWFGLIVGAALLVRALSRAPGGAGADPLEPPLPEIDGAPEASVSGTMREG